MSDEEEEWVSEEESEPDFSASEDEWKPTKQDKESSDSDFQVDRHSDDEIGGDTRKRKLPKSRSSSSSTRGRGTASSSSGPPSKQSLRNKLYNKYRPPPRTYGPAKQNSSLTNILEKSKYARKTLVSSLPKEDEDDSDSSGDDNLVDPSKIDLSSSFFKKTEKVDCLKPDETPDFDCNVGCLTDSGSDEAEEDPEEQSQTNENFSKLHNFNSTLERAREALKKYQANNVAIEESKADDIGAILAAGERAEPESSGTKSKSVPKRKLVAAKHDSDSEWEDVNELEIKPKTETARADGSVQITVQLPGGHDRKRNKQLELELSLKRKLNRIKKENQLDLHKTNILCWVAHMNYVNQILNNPILMGEALKMIPSSQCYPKDKTDIDYFEQLSRFYKTVIVVKNNTLYPPLKKRPTLECSLGLQIKNKSAICKRDYVFIFVILARAIGLQCRIVYNLVVASIRPALADLVPINRSAEPKKNIKKEVKNDEKEKLVEQVKVEPAIAESNKQPTKIAQPNKSNSVKVGSKIKKQTLESIKAEPTIKKPLAKLAQPGKLESVKAEPKAENQMLESIKAEPKKAAQRPKRQPAKTSHATTKKSDLSAEPNATGTVSNQTPLEITTPKKPENIIKAKAIVNLAPQKSTNSPTRFRKSANLAKLKLGKQNGGSNIIPIEYSPIKTRSRADKKLVQIDQLDGADDDFAEPKRKKRATRTTKVEVTAASSSASVISNPGTSKPGTKPTSIQEKPANLAKLKSKDEENKVVKKRASSSAKKIVDSDEDFRPSPVKKQALVKTKKNLPVSTAKETKSGIDRRCVSPDVETEVIKKKVVDGSDYWVELYSEKSKRWYCVDLFKAKVDCAEELYRQATSPVAYVMAWQNDNTLKDVSPRYCPHWNTTTRTLRVPQYWLDEALKSFVGKKTSRDKREDLELNKLHLDQPMPKAISEFKNHPLYALQRHLLKFEAIYPPDALTLGFIRNEPIYARECVHTLRSRELWVKQARVVKPGENPYKIVTARPKWDRLTQTVIKGVPLEIFGIWQTKEYEPPTAENGIVPRNAYGNVELFKECMLPKKTVHLRLNGLNRICKKLQIDCAPAVVGFDYHSGSCHPVFDGFIICEEFGDTVVDAWFDDQAEQEKRDREKYEKRVYGNWKRLIRGLLIREKIKIKYKLEPSKLND